MALAATVGIAMAGSSVYQGQQQKKAQKRALLAQEQAQDEASATAAAAQRRSEMEQRRAGKTPDVGSLLGTERQAALRGPGSTMLTGSTGIESSKLKLGKSSLLSGGGG